MKQYFYFTCLIPGVVFGASNFVEIKVDGGVRYITSNGIPDHRTGQFPNRNNPNRISEQSYLFQVPQNPAIATSITPLGRHPFGVAINGVPFDPGTAEFYNNDPNSGWNYEAQSDHVHLGLDSHIAHVQPSGAYHYHGLPQTLVKTPSGEHPNLIGYAADGFPIYPPVGYRDVTEPTKGLKALFSSYRLKQGSRNGGPGGKYDGRFVQDFEFVQGLGDLDECNGRYGVTPEYPQGTYYYVITKQFPFIPRCFVGSVDSSFYRHGPQGGPPGQRPQGNAGASQANQPLQITPPSNQQSPSQNFRRPPPRGPQGNDLGNQPPPRGQQGDSFGNQLPPPPQGNNFGNQPPPPPQGNNFGNQPPPPPQGNNFGNQPPPPPQGNNFGNQPPPPPQGNNFGNQPPPPPQGNNFGQPGQRGLSPPPDQFGGGRPPPPRHGRPPHPPPPLDEN